MDTHEQHVLVRVFWEGPFAIDEVLSGKKAGEVGLYQIYGQHVVFGPAALLYVGMTDKQSFGERFKQHRDRWLRYESDVQIRLGLIRAPEEQARLAHTEMLTIWWHSPPYNSKGEHE